MKEIKPGPRRSARCASRSVKLSCHPCVDIVTVSVTCCFRTSPNRTGLRPAGRKSGVSAAPARGLAIRSRAALGINPLALRLGRDSSLDWDRQGWVTPTQQRGRVPGSKSLVLSPL